jgi:putative hydroxymethylpyrimidine transport system substrate-binding protein
MLRNRVGSALAAVLLWLAPGAPAAAETLTLMLDWFPNVDHVPIYTAREQGYFAAEGLNLEILSPADTADGLKLAAAGQVDLAVSYQPQVIMAAAEGLEVRVVGRLVGQPLTTLLFLADSGITTPADLNGRAIGYTVPGLMDGLLAAFARVNGITDYRAVNVGFAIVPALTTGRVAAVMGPFKTYETVTMAAQGLKAAYFELERHGIPVYDELIVISGASTLAGKAEALGGFARALGRGLERTRTQPEEALEDYFRAVPEADREVERPAFELTRPCFAGSQRVDPAAWQRFADFAREAGLISRAVAVEGLFGDTVR